MKAVVYDRFGGPEVLRVADLAAPADRPGAARVNVHAAALNPKDSLIRKGRFALLSGRHFPQGLGYDFAGTLDAPVAGFSAGERVFGMLPGFRGATLAETLIISPEHLARMPAGLSFEEAAALPLVCLTALQALEPAIQRARTAGAPAVLIHGASGGVGVHAIQIARTLGAKVITTSSQANLAACAALGADETLDYRVTTGLDRVAAFDVVFDVFGNQSFKRARASLKPDGTYVTTVPSARNAFDELRTRFSQRRAELVVVRSRQADLKRISAWVESQQLRPVIDRVFELSETAEAQRLIETKRARGKVVIRVTAST